MNFLISLRLEVFTFPHLLLLLLLLQHCLPYLLKPGPSAAQAILYELVGFTHLLYILDAETPSQVRFASTEAAAQLMDLQTKSRNLYNGIFT